MKCVGLTVLMVISTINGWPTEEDFDEPLDAVRPRNGLPSSLRSKNGGQRGKGQSGYGVLEYYNDGNAYMGNSEDYAQKEAKSHRRQNSANVPNSRFVSGSRDLNAQQASYRSREPQIKQFERIHSLHEDQVQLPSDAFRRNIQLEHDARIKDNRNYLEKQSGSSRFHELHSGFHSPDIGGDDYDQLRSEHQFLQHGGSAFRDSHSAIKSSLDLESAHRRAYNSKDTEEIGQQGFVRSYVIDGPYHVPNYIENKRPRPILYYNHYPNGPASTFQRPKTFSNPLLRGSGKNFENEYIENEPESYARETKRFVPSHRHTGPSQPRLTVYRNIVDFTNEGSSKNNQREFERNTKEYINKALKEADAAEKYAKDIADKLSAFTNSIDKDLHKVKVVKIDNSQNIANPTVKGDQVKVAEFADNTNSENPGNNEKVKVVDYQRPTYYIPHGNFPNVNNENADKVKVVDNAVNKDADKVKVVENAVNKDENKVKVVEVAKDSGNQDDREKVNNAGEVLNADNYEVNVADLLAGNSSISGIDGIWNPGPHNSHLLRYNHQSHDPVFQAPTYYLPSGKFTNNPRYKPFYPSVVSKPNYGHFLDYPVQVRKGYIPHRIGGSVNVVENADNSQNFGQPINKDDDKVKVIEIADNSAKKPNVNDENADKVKVVENAVNNNEEDKVKVVDLPNDSGHQDDGEKVKFVNNNTGDNSNNGVNVVESNPNNPIIQGIWNQGNDNSHLLRNNHQSNEPIYHLPHGKFGNNPKNKDLYPSVAIEPHFSPSVDYPVHVRGTPRIVNTDAHDGAPGFMTSPSNINQDSEYSDSVTNAYKSRPTYNGKNDVKSGPLIGHSYYRNPPYFVPNPAANGPTTIVEGFQVPDISPVFADVIALPNGTYIPSDGNKANISKDNNAPESENLVKPVKEKLPQEILPSPLNENDLEKGVPSSSLETTKSTSVIEDSNKDPNSATNTTENNGPAANEVPNVVGPTTIIGDSSKDTGFQLPDVSPTFINVLVQPDGTLTPIEQNNSTSTNDSEAPVSLASLENFIEQLFAHRGDVPETNENDLENKIVSPTQEENKGQNLSTNGLPSNETPNDKNQQETSETETSKLNDLSNKENKLPKRHRKGSKHSDRVKHKRSKRKHRKGAKKTKKPKVDKIEATNPVTGTPLTKNDEPSKTNDNTKIIEDVKVSEDQKAVSKESDLSQKVKRENDENTIIESTKTKEKHDEIDHPSEKNKEAQENETISEDNDLLNGEGIKKDIESTGGEKDNKPKRKHKHRKRSKGRKSSSKRRHKKDKKSRKHKNNQNFEATNKNDDIETKTIINDQESSTNQPDKTIKNNDDTVSNPKEDTAIDVKDKTEKDKHIPENSSVTTNHKAEDSKNDEESVNKDTEKKKPSDVTAEETKGAENEVKSDDTGNTADLKANDKDTKSDSTKGW